MLGAEPSSRLPEKSINAERTGASLKGWAVSQLCAAHLGPVSESQFPHLPNGDGG